MIAPPGTRQISWQSSDGLMETGTAQLAKQTYGYISLGPRPINGMDIQSCIQFLGGLPVAHPLLLLSNCPGFALSIEDEQQGLVFKAGNYRAVQQQRKDTGGLILSYVEEIAVGGIYLMHGLSAQYRVAADNTVFYDTVPSRPPVPLQQAKARGLLDEIIPTGTLELWLTTLLSKHSRLAEY